MVLVLALRLRSSEESLEADMIYIYISIYPLCMLKSRLLFRYSADFFNFCSRMSSQSGIKMSDSLLETLVMLKCKECIHIN